MSNLKQSFEQVLNEVNAKEAELGRLIADAKDKTVALTEREQAVETREHNIITREKAVSHIEDVVAKEKELSVLNNDLQNIKHTTLSKERELKDYENRLFEIGSRQKATDLQLQARERAVAEREKKYKEEVQTSLSKALASKLLDM